MEKMKQTNVLDRKGKKNKKKVYIPEFKYPDERPSRRIRENRILNLVYVDPGKIKILTAINDKDEIFKYTCGQLLKETNAMKPSCQIL